MNIINLSIFGSNLFLDILSELEFNNILNPNNVSNNSDKKIVVKILFAENLKTKEVKKYLLMNEPIILFLNHKDFINKNNIKLLDFHVSLELPIEILSFKEILNILITKYNFFKKSRVIMNDYVIDSNERSITKQKVKVKLTEKELELILVLNNNNGLNKSYLETHAFETHLHRLRKKMNKYFNDENFIVERNSLYYLNN
jgi:hypothetical protein